MAHLAIIGSHTVNGVAALHTAPVAQTGQPLTVATDHVRRRS
jgi:glucan phosphorylase